MTPPTMFSKLLIANRGEIDPSLSSELPRMGIRRRRLSTADKDAAYCNCRSSHLHRRRPPRRILLEPPRIISARAHDVRAIHPGYGFLAENDPSPGRGRAESTFIATSQRMAAVGDKVAASASPRSEGSHRPGSKARIEDEKPALN